MMMPRLQEVSAYLGINRDDLGNLRRQIKDIPMDDSNPFSTVTLKSAFSVEYV